MPPDERRKTSCGNHQVDPRFAMCLASACPVCRPPMPPPPQDLASVSRSCVQGTMRGCSGPRQLFWKFPGDAHQQAVAQDIASLPMQMGEARNPVVGTCSFWASWADALPIAPQTRLICVHTPVQEPATSCVDVPQHLNSGLHPWCFGRLCVRGCGCLSC